MELTRSDLNRKYSISDYTWKARHDELLDYLREYMDIKEIKSDTNRYSYEITGEIPDSIPKIPRKSQKLEKIEDYSVYVRGHLPYDFQPYSKAYMARQAINDFGHSKYSHNNEGYIAKAFVGPAMNQYGEHTTKQIWVSYQTYRPLTQEQLAAWKEILRLMLSMQMRKEKISVTLRIDLREQGIVLKMNMDLYL